MLPINSNSTQVNTIDYRSIYLREKKTEQYISKLIIL